MHSQPANTEALIQRVGVLTNGYAMGIHLAAHTGVRSWYAEVTLPSGAVLTPGPHTRLDGAALTPRQPHLGGAPNNPAHGVVWAEVTGTHQAPIRVAVWADTDLGAGQVRIADPVTTNPRMRSTAPATDDSWPGSELLRARASSGSGGGGGGGGGGQCELFVDLNNGIVRHKTDAGGGGGAGGGGQTYAGRYVN